MSPEDVTVLIVDDDKGLLETISLTFKLFKFNVVSLSSGNQAINYLKENDADIIISDIRMPDGSGMELLNFVKQKSVSLPKVLFISGFSDYSLQEMYDSGVDGFFSKPFNASTVKDAITRSLLTETDRWANIPPGSVDLRIKKEFKSLKECIAEKQLLLGRGGFCFSTNKDFPADNSLIDFEFSFSDDPKFSEISGVGRVRWTQTLTNQSHFSGMGVEFEYLEEDCIEKYLAWMNEVNQVSFIPYP